MRKMRAMQEKPHVRIDSAGEATPCSLKTSMATRKRLCERIQCEVTEMVRIGMLYVYGRERKYVERWEPRGDVTRSGRRRRAKSFHSFEKDMHV